MTNTKCGALVRVRSLCDFYHISYLTQGHGRINVLLYLCSGRTIHMLG